jgi:hypothetical protein
MSYATLKGRRKIMTKTITRIINKKTTSVELKSVLGRELYICNNGNWTDVLNEFSFSYTSEQFCQYISDLVEWAEYNNTWLDITEGKAKHREIINLVKEKLTEFFSEYDYSFFPKFYKTLSAKEKKAAVLILSHSELFNYGCIPVMYPSTNELSLLWKGNKKLKKCLFVPVKGPDYELTVNMFTGEVVSYADMDIIEGNF